MPTLSPCTPGSLGHRILVALALRLRSQRWLAKESGCSPQTLSQLIHGKIQGSRDVELLTRLATTLEVAPLWLEKGLGSPPWATAPLPRNPGYYRLLAEYRLKASLDKEMGLYVPTSYDIPYEVVCDPTWRPAGEELVRLARRQGREVEIDEDFGEPMPSLVKDTVMSAIQMALDRCEEQDREKFRLALNWVEKATSE